MEPVQTADKNAACAGVSGTNLQSQHLGSRGRQISVHLRPTWLMYQARQDCIVRPCLIR